MSVLTRKGQDVIISVSEISGNGIIIASGDVTINSCNSFEDSQLGIYSIEGNIDCNYGVHTRYNGLLYAPNGRISISSYNIEFYGSIIGKSLYLPGNIKIKYCKTKIHDYFINPYGMQLK